ncbi:MAG: gluconate 2-dehydrogenase subunit 3 family protein, partial [Ferruginibacter sp.]
MLVIKMVDDLYEKEVQQNFIKGLQQVEAIAVKQFNNSFINCTSAQKQQILLGIESRNGYSGEVLVFYGIMKQRSIEGYLSSEYVLK